jgi:D-alanyl-D-alanine carboxypeptidase/D-alanyl-D-alanine-endopeptidase (penicillin-binding protein 4)
MRTVNLFIGFLICFCCDAQTVSQRLQSAINNFESDVQMKNGIIGFHVLNAKTGAVVYTKNGQVGLVAASSQKVITSTTALETLGPAYRYKTDLSYDGTIENGTLKGNLYLVGSGDPTTGSWRSAATKESILLNKWIDAIAAAGIKKINGKVLVYDKVIEESIPGGWIWDDIGNYYGAGATNFNWRENQYDIKLASGKPGGATAVVGTEPVLYNNNFINEIVAGKEGSGDNAIIFRAPLSSTAFLRGTISPNEKGFTISGSIPSPAFQLSQTLSQLLQEKGYGENLAGNDMLGVSLPPKLPSGLKTIYSHLSPALDSINYWFLKKSLNLYGEALLKTLGSQKKMGGTIENGLSFIRSFWKTNGVDSFSIKMEDGSGLSPKNRITAEALAKVMLYAKGRPWFNSFYKALPELNGLNMKSGSMGGVRSYTGYSGDYVFSIIVNNYNGSAADIQKKMWKVLDVLK